MITSLAQLCDAYLQNVVARDEETKQHRIVGRTGFVTNGEAGFFWSRDGVKFHPFDPNIDSQRAVAVVACQLLFKPWRAQRAYRRQHARNVATTRGRRAAKRAS